MSKEFKGVLIDFDNTLYDYDPCHNAALKRSSQYCLENLDISLIDFHSAYQKSRKLVNLSLKGTAASHNRLIYFQRLLESLSINSMEHSLNIYNVYWNTYLDEMKFSDGAEELLKSFGNRKVCLITDLTAHIQHRKIKRLKLFQYADHLVTSEEAGAEKPDKAIFSMALEKMNTVQQETCIIGDNYEKDIVGAINMGIKSFWLNKTHRQVPSHPLVKEFTEFNQIINIFL